MKALVTGAGGFLGGALARALKDRGWEVVGFARGSYPDLEEKGILFKQGDLADPPHKGEGKGAEPRP